MLVYSSIAAHCELNYKFLHIREDHIHYYKRIPGPTGRKILLSADFEPHVSIGLKYQAALSISSFYDQEYLIRQVRTNSLISAKLALLLSTRRPSNPGFAIIFWANSQKESKVLVSLILYNEFQMPLGCYIHEHETFYSYAGTDAQSSKAFFDEQLGNDLIYSLQALECQSLESIASRREASTLLHMPIYGWSKSFGHALWNDTLGIINLNSSYFNSGLTAAHLCIGPRCWVPLGSLSSAHNATSCFEDEQACNLFSIQNEKLLHWPIGFSITGDYTRFWKEQVMAFCSKEARGLASSYKRSNYPVISFILRVSEWWRKSWLTKYENLLELAQLITAVFPAVSFVIDGMTSLPGKCNDSNYPCISSEFINNLRDIAPVINMHGWPLADKIGIYKAVSYSLGEFGSGNTIPDWIYSIPSIVITGETELALSYGNPHSITRICKPSMMNAERYAHFLPAEYILLQSTGYALKMPAA